MTGLTKASSGLSHVCQFKDAFSSYCTVEFYSVATPVHLAATVASILATNIARDVATTTIIRKLETIIHSLLKINNKNKQPRWYYSSAISLET